MTQSHSYYSTMGCYVVHSHILLFLFQAIGKALGDESTIWDKQIPVIKLSDLQIPFSIPDIASHIPRVGTLQSSNKKPSLQPNVFININNFFCLTGTQEVNVDPIKTQIFNIAGGNQEIYSPLAHGITCNTQPRTTTVKPIFELTNKDAQRLVLPSYCQHCNSGCRVSDKYTNNRNDDSKCDWDVFHRIISEIPQPVIYDSKSNCEELCQLKNLLSRKGGAGTSVSKIESVLENHKLSSLAASPKMGTNHDRVPNLKLFINGKRINELQESQNNKNYNTPSNNFNEEVVGSSLTPFVDVNAGIGRKSTLCDNDDYITCKHDVIIFREGFQLTYDQIEIVFEEITDRPGEIQFIVPNKVTGPFFKYFQHVENYQDEPTLSHGVCVLSNGFLVPIKSMMSLTQLHGWLSTLNRNFTSESFHLLHVSPWTDLKSILGMMLCLIKSGKIVVVLPSNQKISFDLLEQQEHLIPDTLKEHVKVEFFGFSISYVVFKKGLLELCDTIGTPHR